MPSETLIPRQETQYTQKSFELVFHSFCSQYATKICEATGENTAHHVNNGSYLGLPQNATLRQMKDRLDEAIRVVGEPMDWASDTFEASPTKEHVLLSARHLAWYATVGSLTQGYIDRLNGRIEQARADSGRNGSSGHNLDRLFSDRKEQVSLLIAQNSAIREYFESDLARQLGNDSPVAMGALLSKAPFMDDLQRDALVSGISLEIATERYIEHLITTEGDERITLAHGDDSQDSRGGDFVLVCPDEIVYLDIKSTMPKKFTGRDNSTPQDYERGYKWLADDESGARKVVLWAYLEQPIQRDGFNLVDSRLANNLKLVLDSLSLDY